MYLTRVPCLPYHRYTQCMHGAVFVGRVHRSPVRGVWRRTTWEEPSKMMTEHSTAPPHAGLIAENLVHQRNTYPRTQSHDPPFPQCTMNFVHFSSSSKHKLTLQSQNCSSLNTKRRGTQNESLSITISFWGHNSFAISKGIIHDYPEWQATFPFASQSRE